MECTAGVIFGSSISMLLSGSLLLLLLDVVDVLELVEGGVVEVLERGVLAEAEGGVLFLVDVLLAAGGARTRQDALQDAGVSSSFLGAASFELQAAESCSIQNCKALDRLFLPATL